MKRYLLHLKLGDFAPAQSTRTLTQEGFLLCKDARLGKAPQVRQYYAAEFNGIEGYTPDHLPVIGRGSQPGVIHGFGFSAHGFQLGPAVGEALADLVMARQPRVNLDAFAPGRFKSQPEKDLF